MRKIDYSDKQIIDLMSVTKAMVQGYGPIGLHEPEDIVQMVMIKLLRRPNATVPPKGWIAMAVRSTVTDLARATSKRIKYVSFLQEDKHSVCEREDDNASSWDRLSRVPMYEAEGDPYLIEQLSKMLQQLSSGQRTVLLLHAAGYTYEEIALVTKSRIGTVRSQLHYAKKRVQPLAAKLK